MTKTAIIDLDGTVYRSGKLIPGADVAIQALRDAGYQTLFLTNSATHTREEYQNTLDELGISASASEVLSSGFISAAYIATEHPSAAVYVIGEPALDDELQQQGVKLVSHPREANILLLSRDTDIDYTELKTILRHTDEDTVILGTNPDVTVPGEDGPIPGAGTIIGAIERMTGRTVTILGKPAQTTVDIALNKTGATPSNSVIIGDRLDTDMQMGVNAGLTTVLVLSGSTDKNTLSESSITPDHVLSSLTDIEEFIQS